MHIKWLHWFIGLFFACLLHIALGFILFYQDRNNGARDLGVGGLDVSVTMIAAAMGSESQQEILPDVQEEPVINEIDEPTPEEVVEDIKPEPVKPVIEEELPPVKEAVIITPPKTPPLVKEPTKKITPPRILPKPTTKPKKPTPKRSQDKTQKPPQEKILGRNSQGSVEQASDADRADTKTQQGGGAFVSDIKPDYITELRYWLERHKTYPKASKRRREVGIVIVEFIVLREGTVTFSKIRKTSGFTNLDQETLDMLKRAQPLPKFPKEMVGDQLKIALPIQFSLR